MPFYAAICFFVLAMTLYFLILFLEIFTLMGEVMAYNFNSCFLYKAE